MPAYTATAPGKIILMGEHAVVYGQPAIAVPLNQVEARAVVQPEIAGTAGQVRIVAPAVGMDEELLNLEAGHPLRRLIRSIYQELGIERAPAYRLRITATIPIAAGMGSGAAVSVAVAKALSGFLGGLLPDDRVSALAFEIDKLYHGTPSGIDNTVIAYNRPVYFVRDRTVERLELNQPITLVVGDTGIPSPTGAAVGDVRRAWEEDHEKYESLFAQIGDLSRKGRQALLGRSAEPLGPLLSANHELLRKLAVSSPALDKLVLAALDAGAAGAKLSGGGRGGNMIALVEPQLAGSIAERLSAAGAVRTLITSVPASR